VSHGVEPDAAQIFMVFLWRETMMSSLVRQASHGTAALGRVLAWRRRVSAERTAMRQLARMSDHELSDIGLARQDIIDVGAVRPDVDRYAMLALRLAGRKDTAA
jgi:uncharacterized protein YjiS (DUF1127 family)